MPPTRPINWRAVLGIIRKDLRVVSQSKSVVYPMLIVPLIFFVIVPIGLAVALRFFREVVEQSNDFAEIVQIAPAFLHARFPDATPFEIAALYLLRYMFAPLFLIMPIMTASVIAADAFAGERERKTLEALLYTPTTDFELMLAKLLGALVPAVVLAWASALLYWIVVDIAAWPLFGRPILPDVTWLLLALWVAPAAAGAALGTTVIVSARAKSFQDANQISGLVVLPVVALMIGQSTGVLALSPALTALVGLVFWGAAALLVAIGARTLRRSEMLARL